MERKKARRFLQLKEWPPQLDGLFRPTPEYLTESDGSLRDIPYRVRTDEDGYIVSPGRTPEETRKTVIFFGDSFVESLYVPEEQRFVAVIRDLLSNNGIQIHCLNAGRSGATTLHILMSLIGKVGRRPETTIVLVMPSNDAYALTMRGGFWGRSNKRYSPIVPVPEHIEQPKQPLDLAEQRATLSLFVDACNRFALRLVLATFPHRTASFDDDPWLARRFSSLANYERVNKWRSAINAVGRNIAMRRSIAFIDLEALISNRSELFYDDLHMNELGSAEVAQIMGGFLRSTLLD